MTEQIPNNFANSDVANLVNQLEPIDIRAELFKKGNFDFIVKGKDEDGVERVHEKQKQALKILTSNIYDEFLYGGAAGGAKSWTGICWILFMAICYPGTKYFIARNELKDIVDSVLVTWNKVCKEYGFEDWKFNAVKNFIQLGNGSHINFIELKYKPSDPMYEDVGSTEYTCGWIEEVGEINEVGADTISTRVGRHLNSKYKIKGVVLYTCNPKKNWAKREFYDKSINGVMETENKDPEKPTKAYLGCLVTENPFIEKDYIKKLKNKASKNKSMYERLFKGNWNYEDSPDALCEYDMVEQIFDNDQVPQGQYTYITADIARLGSDKAVIGVWRGWRLIFMKVFDTSKTTEIQSSINILRRKYGIPKNRCIADEDGVGGGVVDNCGILGFVNGSRPLKEKGVSKSKKEFGKPRPSFEMPNYKNLQVQCLYHLADRINEGNIWLMCDISETRKSEIVEELDQIRSKISDVGKLDCKSKSDIKSDIGRSPDYRDMILMRVFFDLKPTRKRRPRAVSRSSI